MPELSTSVSPIKVNRLTNKSFETPIKFLTQQQNIFEQQYYKDKCSRLQQIIKQLKQEIRILETQNKELKTQIQLYRASFESRNPSQGFGKTSSNDKSNKLLTDPKDLQKKGFDQSKPRTISKSQEQQLQKLRSEIRVIRNSHQIELNENKNHQKRLSERIRQLENQIHSKQKTRDEQKNHQIQKQLKQMKKSIIQYMEQRDQNQNQILKLQLQLQQKNQIIQQLQSKQKPLQQSNQFKHIDLVKQEEANLKEEAIPKEEVNPNEEANTNEEDQIPLFQVKEQLESEGYESIKNNLNSYQFGVKSIKNIKNLASSSLSLLTFNEDKQASVQEAFEVIECLKTQIHLLENQLKKNIIIHRKQIQDLNCQIKKYQKSLKQKDQDIVNLLTKVKPLLHEKNRMISKQNQLLPRSQVTNLVTNQTASEQNFKQERQKIGKNVFGFKMLDLFLKKYKM